MNVTLRDRPFSHRPFSKGLRAVSVACVLSFLAGCDVRDEEARVWPASPWLPGVNERLSSAGRRSSDSTIAERTMTFVDGYAAGSRRAMDGRCPMLVVFRAAWCPWSDSFVAEILREPRLAGLAGRFVCVTVDADRDPATCRSFGVQAFPTAIVLDRERRETFRATGAAARERLPLAVEAVLATTVPQIAGQPAATPR